MSADPAVPAAVMAMRELILALEKHRQVSSVHLGLSISESQAVSYLLARGPMGQTELGTALGFNTSSTTALVDRLERNGFAERRPDPHDRRRSTVRLSKAGRAALRDARGWMSSAFEHVDPDQLPALTTTLLTLAADLQRHAERVSATRAPRSRP